jgi:hydrogenase maturation protein HypF
VAVKVTITGIVQGVGFRPFVANLARSMGIVGTVQNTGGGVEIIAEGLGLDSFIQRLSSEKPPMAHIADFTVEPAVGKYEKFDIIESETKPGIVFVPIDLAICPDCAKELLDPANRRYGYPFINCTQCGPRYSIIESLPYDRKSTTMAAFTMCPDCAAEYAEPSDRRYHAQPNACGVCGPDVWLGDLRGLAAIKQAAELVNAGEIIAMRGLGGYHLICDATNDAAVLRLRALKHRPTKPFAVMCDDKALLATSKQVEEAIFSPAAPIVIFDWQNHLLSRYINSLNSEIGVMSAYTPLHKLLLQHTTSPCIVATSGNLRDEAIVADINEAEARLRHFTPHLLHHNRPIRTRSDDSVITAHGMVLRRGRGYAPFPVVLPMSSDKIVFAAGAQLKNCLSIVKGKYAFVSQYLGDLDNADTVDFYRETYSQMCKLLDCTPELAICDLHDGYFSTSFAKELGIPLLRLQHHHAHMFAAMAEHGLQGDVIAAIMDGTGYGEDHCIWGGEFFSYIDGVIAREAHLDYIGQAGGDAAVRQPARMAQSFLLEAGLWDDYWLQRMMMAADTALLNGNMLKHNISVLPTSSAGRLFEAVGAMLLGIGSNEYEGHAAIALEAAAARYRGVAKAYPYGNTIALVAAVAEDIRKGERTELIAYSFHTAVSNLIHDKLMELSRKHSIRDAVLSGGVFQNKLLLRQVTDGLRKAGLSYYIPKTIPINDGGISLGQAYWAVLTQRAL